MPWTRVVAVSANDAHARADTFARRSTRPRHAAAARHETRGRAASSDEFPTDAPARTQETYLDRLAAYADEDGYTLDAPTRYSIADWWLNLRNLPSSSVLQRVQGHLVANTFFAILVSGLAYAIKAEHLAFDTTLLEADHLNLGGAL